MSNSFNSTFCFGFEGLKKIKSRLRAKFSAQVLRFTPPKGIIVAQFFKKVLIQKN